MSKTIFTVTTLTLLPKHSSRCVGYYFDKKDALECIEQNLGDIHEDSYKYAVIEEVESGLYPHTPSFLWFQWIDDNDYGHYVQCCVPESEIGVCNYGIG